MKKKKRSRLHHYLLPHAGNKYRPRIFTRQSVALIVLAILALQGLYYVQVHFILGKTGFMASVLPAALTDLANADRAKEGIAALVEDPQLDAAASAKAADMAAKGYFAHVAPDGTTPWHWLDAVNYPYTYAGENLAEDFSDSKDVEEAWMNSPMHRANILKAQYTHVGIGTARGVYEGKEVTFVVQFFAARSDDAQPAVAQKSEVHEAAKTAPTDIATVAKAPTATPAVLGESTAKSPSAPVAPAPSAPSIAVLSTAPSHVMLYALSALAAFFALLYVLMLSVHVRRRVLNLELTFGGAAVIAVALLFIYMDHSFIPGVQVPTSEAASAAAVFR